MAQPTILENLEEIMTADAAFPFDAVITQIFTNTVNVKPVGSRTIIRDVALPEHIKADDLEIGYPVRLGNSGSKITVTAYFEQFADPESFNYAGLGSKVPGKPTLSVTATKAGWVLTWPKVTYATKYLVYQNDSADGDSPELVLTINVTDPNLASYTKTLSFDSPFIYFAVQACNGLLEGDTSLWKTDVTPPAAPVWKTHAYQSGGHYVEWSHPSPADVMEFVVYYNESPAPAGAVEVDRTSNLNYIVPYLDSYDYIGVQAVDWSGNNTSAIVWTVEYDPTPATPSGFQANLDANGGYTCSWAATTKAVSYEVQGMLDEGEAGQTWTTYYSSPALKTGVIRYANIFTFRVRAIGLDGSASPWSAGVTDTFPPPQPAITITNGAKQITISLASDDQSHISIGFSHYILEIANSAIGAGETYLDWRATYDSFPRVIEGQTGVTKYYRLIPVDWAGNSGSPSAWTAGTPISFGEGGATVQDKFDGYGGSSMTPVSSLYWLLIHDFHANSGTDSWWADWFKTNPAPRSTTLLIDGTNSLHLVSNGALGNSAYANYFHPTGGWDYSQDGRFGSNDYVVLAAYVSNASTLTKIDLTFGVGTDGSLRKSFTGPFVTGWNYLKAKKSEFVPYDDPITWAYIGNITIQAFFTTATGSPYVDVDDLRIVKAHPDDPTITSDVGAAWGFAASSGTNTGQWHIYTGNRVGEPSKPFSFGQVNHVASPTLWYLAHKPTDTDIKAGTIQAGVFHHENGKSGLAFFIKNVTPGYWTMYAIEADNTADTVTLVRWNNGTRTVLGSGSLTPFYSAAGGATAYTVWIGADFSQYDSDGGRIKVYASTVEGNLIQAGNLKISVQDTLVGSGGTVGLLSNQTNVRFVNFTAGSPAHADVADVAKALDGPIIAGDKRRVQYDLTNNRFNYTDDGNTFYPVAPITSINRPGVTRLYRGDSDAAPHQLRMVWDGSYMALRAYQNDAQPDSTPNWNTRCYYSDVGYTSYSLNGYSSADLHANGQVVELTADITGKNGDYTVVWQGTQWGSGMWDGATKLVAQRTGWHIWYCCINITPTANTDNVVVYCYLNGGTKLGQHNDRRAASTQGLFGTISGIAYLSAGNYLEIHTTIGAINYNITATSTGGGCLFGLLSLEKA